MDEPDRNDYFKQQIKHCLTEAQGCSKHAAKIRRFHNIFIGIGISYNMVFIPLAIYNFLQPGWLRFGAGLLVLALCAHMAWCAKGHFRDRVTDFNKWMGYREQWLGYAAQWKQHQKEYNGYES